MHIGTDLADRSDRMTRRALFQLWREVRGQDLTEYALLVAMLALALVSDQPEPLGLTAGAA
jgi:hypothetical protein